jgi:hypothetical protein
MQSLQFCLTFLGFATVKHKRGGKTLCVVDMHGRDNSQPSAEQSVQVSQIPSQFPLFFLAVLRNQTGIPNPNVIFGTGRRSARNGPNLSEGNVKMAF